MHVLCTTVTCIIIIVIRHAFWFVSSCYQAYHVFSMQFYMIPNIHSCSHTCSSCALDNNSTQPNIRVRTCMHSDSQIYILRCWTLFSQEEMKDGNTMMTCQEQSKSLNRCVVWFTYVIYHSNSHQEQGTYMVTIATNAVVEVRIYHTIC